MAYSGFAAQLELATLANISSKKLSTEYCLLPVRMVRGVAARYLPFFVLPSEQEGIRFRYLRFGDI